MAEPFAPFTTDRLTIRAFRPDEAHVVAAYRNDPDVARYQDWPVPYPPERAVRVVGEYARAGTEPAAGQHRQLAVDLASQFVDRGAVVDEVTGLGPTLLPGGLAGHAGPGIGLGHPGSSAQPAVERTFVV